MQLVLWVLDGAVTPDAIPPWIIASTAVAALLLSLYNAYTQWRNRQRQEERWRQEKLPNLIVTSDSRVGYGLPVSIYSLRIVNSSGVPVEIRALRMMLPEGRHLPLPQAEPDVRAHKWETEIPVGEGLPYVLQPGQSVRFATGKNDMEARLRSAGFTDHLRYLCRWRMLLAIPTKQRNQRFWAGRTPSRR